MNEFNSRMEAQRRILDIVNAGTWQEELFGLSAKGLERWASSNNVDANSELVRLLRSASSKLFFLANKSQEQITDDYRAVSLEIASLSRKIEKVMLGKLNPAN